MTAESAIVMHTPIRARMLANLADHVVKGVRKYGDTLPTDVSVETLAADLHEPPDKIVASLYALQKQALVRFKERKGRNGSEPHDIRVSAAVLRDDVAIETQVDQEVEERLTAIEVMSEAIVHSPTTPCTYRRVAREWCVEHDSHWPRGDMFCAAEWERRKPEEDRGLGPVGVLSTPISDEPAAAPAVELGPEIRALIERASKRARVAEAVAILEATGLDEDALNVMARLPDDTALEAEVLVLVAHLGLA